MWADRGRLSDEEANDLIKPFTMEELERALKDMDASLAPGPDGQPVGSYREFWPQIRGIMLEMFNKLHQDELNLCRLNYCLITFIPKLKESNAIKQYRPICLLNIDHKLFTKILTMRLTPLAKKLINDNQTAFIPNHFILDGVIILHEVLHELHCR